MTKAPGRIIWFVGSLVCGCVSTSTSQDASPDVVTRDGGDLDGTTDVWESDTNSQRSDGGAPLDAAGDVAFPQDSDVVHDGCVPMCVGALCGDDGCGGSCGDCPPGLLCEAGACQETSLDGCPPPGPYGHGMGETAPNLSLYDCEGHEVSLHRLCSRRVSMLYTFAEWCPPCRTFVRDRLEDGHRAWAERGDFETWVVLTENTDGSLPTASDCRRVRESYGIDTPGVSVVFDGDGAVGPTLATEVNQAFIVMKRRNEIVLNGAWSWDTAVQVFLGQAFRETAE